MSSIAWSRSQQERRSIVDVVFDPLDARLVVFSVALLEELDATLEQIERELDTDPADLVVFSSAKPDCFVAGADIGEMLTMRTDAEIRSFVDLAHQLFGRVASLATPTVAIIDGACMGGGTELALACTYRIATDNAKTQIALPEVTLGIIPGWGGTQRLPRLIGVEAALPMMVGGQPISGADAVAIGLVDGCVPATELPASLSTLVARGHPPASRQSPPMAVVARHLVEKTEAAIAKSRVHPAAPRAALQVVRESSGQSLEAGLRIEQEAFVRCLASNTGFNLMSMFFHRGALRKESLGIDASGEAAISRAAVLGAGVMGGGIAWALSSVGVPVTMKDVADEPLARGMAAAATMYDRLVTRGQLETSDAEAGQRLISPTTDYANGFHDVDLVVEAVTEEVDLKKRVLTELEAHVSSSTLICTNTSSLAVEDLATAVARPERFVALHFFNPVNRMRLVEVAAAKATSPKTLATAVELARRLGKTPVVVRGRPGFLVNRILFPYLLEAARVCDETQAVAELDAELVEFGMPMGPLRLIDEVGVDVTVKIATALQAAYGERFAAPALLPNMLDAGLAGRKASGEGAVGFYRHQARSSSPHDELPFAAAGGEEPAATVASGADRCLLMLVNEAARCVEERIVSQPLHVDLTMILGTGFPEHRGGPLRYADQRGLGKTVAAMDQLVQSVGDRFRPCAELKRRAEAGEPFFG